MGVGGKKSGGGGAIGSEARVGKERQRECTGDSCMRPRGFMGADNGRDG